VFKYKNSIMPEDKSLGDNNQLLNKKKIISVIE